MNDEFLEKSCKEIKTALLATGKTEITGAILGELIRDAAKGLDVRATVGIFTGPGAVSKFAETYLKDILERSGNQGSDKVYKIRTSGGATDGAGTSDSSLWHAFVKPKSAVKIFLSSTNQLRVGEEPSEISFDAKSVISPATSQELDDIRSQFSNELSNIDPTLAKQLEGIQSYGDWSNLLKRSGRERVKNWAQFRVEKITHLFVDRLSKLELAPEIVKDLSNELRRSQGAAHANSLAQRTTLSAESGRGPIVAPSANSAQKTVTFREAVIRVVSGMSDNELRELRVPAGAIFDALGGKNDKN